MRQTGINEASN